MIKVLAGMSSKQEGPASKLIHRDVGGRSISTLTPVTIHRLQKTCFHIYSHGPPYRATLLYYLATGFSQSKASKRKQERLAKRKLQSSCDLNQKLHTINLAAFYCYKQVTECSPPSR